MKKLFIIILLLSGCGKEVTYIPFNHPNLPPVGIVGEDDAVIHGRAEVTISSEQADPIAKLISQMFNFTAMAATGATTVTYTNAASVNFTINVASLAGGAFSGDTLSLGSVSMATLSDNNLKVCAPSGNTKCNQAAIRMYTTGSVAGFVQQTDLYGAPVYISGLNPSLAIGLNATGSVQAQNIAIAGNKNKLRISDFPSPTYSVTSDFSNAGTGNYSMQFVVEYILLP